MFSGIIRELGVVKAIKKHPRGVLLIIRSKLYRNLKPGNSLAVDGCCLTVFKKQGKDLVFQVMPETLKRTNLDNLLPTTKVNLEGALKLNNLVAGHLVSGHIDTVGRIKEVNSSQKGKIMNISFPSGFAQYLVPKGSIAVDGVSLTVVTVKANEFSVALIDYTLSQTTLGLKTVNDKVNLEFDLVAKYLAKLISYAKKNK